MWSPQWLYPSKNRFYSKMRVLHRRGLNKGFFAVHMQIKVQYLNIVIFTLKILIKSDMKVLIYIFDQNIITLEETCVIPVVWFLTLGEISELSKHLIHSKSFFFEYTFVHVWTIYLRTARLKLPRNQKQFQRKSSQVIYCNVVTEKGNLQIFCI